MRESDKVVGSHAVAPADDRRVPARRGPAHRAPLRPEIAVVLPRRAGTVPAARQPIDGGGGEV